MQDAMSRNEQKQNSLLHRSTSRRCYCLLVLLAFQVENVACSGRLFCELIFLIWFAEANKCNVEVKKGKCQ